MTQADCAAHPEAGFGKRAGEEVPGLQTATGDFRNCQRKMWALHYL